MSSHDGIDLNPAARPESEDPAWPADLWVLQLEVQLRDEAHTDMTYGVVVCNSLSDFGFEVNHMSDLLPGWNAKCESLSAGTAAIGASYGFAVASARDTTTMALCSYDAQLRGPARPMHVARCPP